MFELHKLLHILKPERAEPKNFSNLFFYLWRSPLREKSNPGEEIAVIPR